MLGAAHDACPRRPARADARPTARRGRVDLDRRRAQPVPQRHARVGEAGRDRVAVPSERDRRVRRDDPGHLDRRGERDGGQRQQRLGVGERADRRRAPGRGAALAGVARHRRGTGPATLRLLGCRRGHRPPPPPARVTHRGFDRALAVPAPRRARLHDRAVMLRDRREARLHVTRCRARSPSPAGRCATPGRCHPRRRITASIASIRCGLVQRLGQHAPRPRPSAAACPASTYAVPPHGARRRSNQSHWISSPGGCSISIVSRPFTPEHASQCGRRPAGGADGRSSDTTGRSRAGRPRRTAPSPTGADHQRTGPGRSPRSRRADRRQSPAEWWGSRCDPRCVQPSSWGWSGSVSRVALSRAIEVSER